MIRSLEGILGGKVGRFSVSSNVGVARRVHRNAGTRVVNASAQVCGIEKRAAVGVDLGHKRIFAAAKGGLDGIDHGKIGRCRVSSYVGVARRVHCNAVAYVEVAPAQVSRVNEGTAVAVELGHEGLIVSVSRVLESF